VLHLYFLYIFGYTVGLVTNVRNEELKFAKSEIKMNATFSYEEQTKRQ